MIRSPKILIVQTAFAGDVILALPMARAVRMLWPEARVHFLAIPETASLLRNHPDIDRVYELDKRGKEKHPSALWKKSRELKAQGYDIAIVPHRSMRSAVLVRLAGIPERIGFHRNPGSFLFTEIIRYPADAHEVDRNLKLLKPLGWDGPRLLPALYPGSGEKKRVDAFFAEKRLAGGDMVALAPGSVWATKRWTAEGYAGVAKRLWEEQGIRSVLVGGAADEIRIREVMAEGPDNLVSAAGQMSLPESAELIRRCRAILCNDSAPLHLAVAVGTPVVAVFGPTVPEFGFAPIGPGDRVVQTDLECRPCAVHGGRRCPRGHFQCMESLSPDTVYRVLLERMHIR